MKSSGRGWKQAGGSVTAFDLRDYLGTIFPALLESSCVPGIKPDLVIQLVVSDSEGDDWWYRITGDAVEARPGVSDQVDLTLSFYSKDLAALWANELDIPRALRASRIKVRGDEAVLRWLSQRLEVA